MQKYKLTDTDAVFVKRFTKENCQNYMDQFGAFEDKESLPRHKEFLCKYLEGGETDLKELNKRIKDSVKEIKKAYKNIKPKKEYPDLSNKGSHFIPPDVPIGGGK